MENACSDDSARRKGSKTYKNSEFRDRIKHRVDQLLLLLEMCNLSTTPAAKYIFIKYTQRTRGDSILKFFL